jgi:hypothetical protein
VNTKEELWLAVNSNMKSIQELVSKLEGCNNKEKRILQKELKELRYLQLWYLDQLKYWE